MLATADLDGLPGHISGCLQFVLLLFMATTEVRNYLNFFICSIQISTSRLGLNLHILDIYRNAGWKRHPYSVSTHNKVCHEHTLTFNVFHFCSKYPHFNSTYEISTFEMRVLWAQLNYVTEKCCHTLFKRNPISSSSVPSNEVQTILVAQGAAKLPKDKDGGLKCSTASSDHTHVARVRVLGFFCSASIDLW